MSKKSAKVYALVDGVKPVDPRKLEAFLKTMNDTVIPEIVRVVEKRRLLAVASRQKQLKY